LCSFGNLFPIELKRTEEDRRLYALEGVGTLRLEGLGGRMATAEAGAESWHITRRGFWRRTIQAADAADSVVGEFEPRGMRRGGALRWAGRELELRPSSKWRERYALADGDSELAVFDGKGWGRRPVEVSLDDPATVEPGLLLFAAFVVHGLAGDASSAAGGATVAGS
jgi:hypothetical protein